MMVPDLYLEHLYMIKHGLKLWTCLRHINSHHIPKILFRRFREKKCRSVNFCLVEFLAQDINLVLNREKHVISKMDVITQL